MVRPLLFEHEVEAEVRQSFRADYLLPRDAHTFHLGGIALPVVEQDGVLYTQRNHRDGRKTVTLTVEVSDVVVTHRTR
jgi:hypothetical protein